MMYTGADPEFHKSATTNLVICFLNMNILVEVPHGIFPGVQIMFHPKA